MRGIHEHLPVFLSPFFLSASVHFKCQPVRTARYLLFPIHKLDSNLRSVSIWKSAFSHRVSLSRMPKRVPDHTLCPWCLHAWEVQTLAIWSRHQSASVLIWFEDVLHVPLNEPGDLFWIQTQSIIPLKCWSHRPVHGRYSENTHFLSAPSSCDTCSICMLRCWLDARCLPGAMWPINLTGVVSVSLCLIDLKALRL